MRSPSPSKSRFVGRFAALTAGLAAGAVLSSFADESPFASFGKNPQDPAPRIEPAFAAFGMVDGETPAEEEISPEEMARELGLPLGEGEPFPAHSGFARKIPNTRVVPPSEFGNYRVNVDVFRKSAKRPVLGPYRDAYAAALVPNSAGLTEEEVSREARKLYARLAAKEFAVLSVDGRPERAYIVSAAIERKIPTAAKDAAGNPILDEAGNPVYRQSKKTTPAGNYRLDALVRDRPVEQADGTRKTRTIANPWLRSSRYQNSQMFWGLWIQGGYFIHSTPHYGQLGQLASMGCIRQSFPDAQALFKLIVEDDLEGMIRIHPLGSAQAASRLREVVVDLAYEAPEGAPVAGAPADPAKDMNWLLAQLARSDREIRDVIGHYGSEVELKGHSWIDAETGRPAATRWPQCLPASEGPADCFKSHKVAKPRNSLN